MIGIRGLYARTSRSFRLVTECCAWLALTSCSTTAPASRGESVVPVTNAKPGANVPAPLHGEEPATTPPSADIAARPAPGPRLDLPLSAAFLAAPLPDAHPERYASFREVSRIVVGHGYLHHVDLLNDELLLVASNEEATARIYDRATKRLVGNHTVPGFGRFEQGDVVSWPGAVARFLAATPEGLLLVDARTGQTLSVLDRVASRELGWSPDGQILVAAAEEDRLRTSRLRFLKVISTEPPQLAPLGTLDFAERVDGWALSADNHLLAVTHYPSGDVRVVDLQAGTDVLRVPGPRYAGSVAFSPDGRLVAVGGQGLLLVDLLHPSLRAFYSHLYNNIGFVRFSPSGDAVVASSFDGRIRIFRYGWEPGDADDGAQHGARIQVSLAKELRHAGNANVYGFVFEPGGDGLVSASGDQTVRTFRGRPSPSAVAGAAASPHTFRSLDEWRRGEPPGSGTPVTAPGAAATSLRDGHYFPPSTAGTPRASRIAPGLYDCKITRIYKLRNCIVTRDGAGHTWLTFENTNLLGLKGLLYDDGPVVRFEGWLTEPSTVVGCDGCEKQPLHAIFRGGGRSWNGLLTFKNYYDPLEPPKPPEANVKLEEASDRFPLVLRFRAREATAGATASPNTVADPGAPSGR